MFIIVQYLTIFKKVLIIKQYLINLKILYNKALRVNGSLQHREWPSQTSPSLKGPQLSLCPFRTQLVCSASYILFLTCEI